MGYEKEDWHEGNDENECPNQCGDSPCKCDEEPERRGGVTEKGEGITEDSFPEFKLAYEEAERKGNERFRFEGKLIYTNYAMYAIQYVESVRAKRNG